MSDDIAEAPQDGPTYVAKARKALQSHTPSSDSDNTNQEQAQL